MRVVGCMARTILASWTFIYFLFLSQRGKLLHPTSSCEEQKGLSNPSLASKYCLTCSGSRLIFVYDLYCDRKVEVRQSFVLLYVFDSYRYLGRLQGYVVNLFNAANSLCVRMFIVYCVY